MRACAREMHLDMSQAPLGAEMCRENARRDCRDKRFVQACAVEMHMDMSEVPFCLEMCRENAGRVARGHRFVRACAVEIHIDMSCQKCHFVWKCAGKIPNASPGRSFCVRACTVKMHMDMSEVPFCVEIFRENAGRVARGHRFVRACAVEMDMDMS